MRKMKYNAAHADVFDIPLYRTSFQSSCVRICKLCHLFNVQSYYTLYSQQLAFKLAPQLHSFTTAGLQFQFRIFSSNSCDVVRVAWWCHDDIAAIGSTVNCSCIYELIIDGIINVILWIHDKPIWLLIVFFHEMFKFKTNNNDTIVISQRPVHTTRT